MVYMSSIKQFYPYRTAFANHSIAIRLSSAQKKELIEWIESENYNFDNHISWEDTSGMCYTYSDSVLYIGKNLKIKNW